jgi:hypothetical protein
LNDELIDVICDSGVPYFDLSLQHVSKPLLRRMRRWGDGERFLDRIEEIREREANRFAAELLMPEDRIHAAVDVHGADVVAQAERFNVTALSMAWRLYNYGYIKRRPYRGDYEGLD